MQFHWGDEVADENLGWHRDGMNSALHIANSIFGRRALHIHQSEAGHTVHWQEPGDIYIGTPFTVRHAVEYPEASYQNRAFAIQARFLFPTDGKCITTSYREMDMEKVMQHVVNQINAAEIIVPTLEQVQQVHNEMFT